MSYEPCVVAFVHLFRSQSPSRVWVCLMRVGMCWWSLLRTLQSLSRCVCVGGCMLFVCVSVSVSMCGWGERYVCGEGIRHSREHGRRRERGKV